jgi:hypothetical protein
MGGSWRMENEWEQARASARAEARERACERARVRVLECILAKGFKHPQTRLEVDRTVANPECKDILHSFEPDRRQQLACDLWHHFTRNSESPTIKLEYARLLAFIAPITRLPSELLHYILLITIEKADQSPLTLMLVSRHWYNMVNGLWASLDLGTRTPKETIMNQNQLSMDVRIDTESDKESSNSSEGAYEALLLATSGADRWRTLTIHSIPNENGPIGDIKRSRLNQCFTTPMLRLETFKVLGRCEQSPLLERLSEAFSATKRNQFDLVQVHCPIAVELLAQPRYAAVFRSIRVLDIEAKGGNDVVDLLPHLVQIEDFRASHLRLPNYPLDRPLPFVHALRHLRLKAVSIQ